MNEGVAERKKNYIKVLKILCPIPTHLQTNKYPPLILFQNMNMEFSKHPQDAWRDSVHVFLVPKAVYSVLPC